MEEYSPLQISCDNIQYIGEGNASIVLGLKGTNKIIRLKKSASKNDADVEILLLQRDYVRFIIKPCFPKGVVNVPEIVKIEENVLKELSLKIFNDRPAFRIAKNKSVHCNHVLMMPNYTMPFSGNGPTLCIELKCKKGFTLQDPLEKCKFCRNQYYKLDQKKISEISGYCPLDLFSGDNIRMIRAILELLNAPQNNLKIFLNGALVFTEGYDLDILIQLLKNYLDISDDNTHIQSLFASVLLEIFTGIKPETNESIENTPTLPEGSVLQTILDLQKLNTSIDITADTQNEYDYAKAMIEQNPLQYRLEHQSPIDILRNKLSDLQKYFISATFADCSIMVALQPHDISNKNSSTIEINRKTYIFNIGVTDLDAKPVSKIDQHKKLEQDVHNALLQFNSTARRD